jgi:single-strand DNA-binding protein
VAGRMTTRKWQNKDGVDQYTTEVVADQMQMLGGKPAEDAPAVPAKPKSDAYRSIKEGNIVPFDDFEDTVPF